MNRKFLLLAGAISALFAGKSATISTPIDLEPVAGAFDIHCDFAAKPTPAPAKSESLPVAPREVAVRTRAVADSALKRFVERPGRRRVKYGKHRWVILG